MFTAKLKSEEEEKLLIHAGHGERLESLIVCRLFHYYFVLVRFFKITEIVVILPHAAEIRLLNWPPRVPI